MGLEPLAVVLVNGQALVYVTGRGTVTHKDGNDVDSSISTVRIRVLRCEIFWRSHPALSVSSPYVSAWHATATLLSSGGRVILQRQSTDGRRSVN